MKIIYIAKHNSGDNDDEGAISYALTQLGHDVVRIPEQLGHVALKQRGDLALFHKWQDTNSIARLNIRKVFWYFDLVEYPDPTIESRNETRRSWMSHITPLVDLGFCTDGDWVNKDNTGKLIRLTQGADARRAGFGKRKHSVPPLLFTGTTQRTGVGRIGHINHLANRWGSNFQQVRKVHGRELANLIADSRMVIAPDSPVTDHYWSNRVYNTLGFGGFLLHPEAKTLRDQYKPGRDLITYSDRDHLDELIEFYLRPENTEQIDCIKQNGLATTLEYHTYQHRCEVLINTVMEKLF